jgi:hypothetical protein
MPRQLNVLRGGRARILEQLRVLGRKTVTDIGSATQDALDSILKLIAQPGFQYIASSSRLKRGLCVSGTRNAS